MKKLITIFIAIGCLIFFSLQANASQKPYSELSISEKRVLAQNSLKIKAGDSFPKVISIMGEPTLEKLISHKQTQKVTGKIIRYYAVIWEHDLVNEIYDEYIMITFNEKGIVTKVYAKISILQ